MTTLKVVGEPNLRFWPQLASMPVLDAAVPTHCRWQEWATVKLRYYAAPAQRLPRLLGNLFAGIKSPDSIATDEIRLAHVSQDMPHAFLDQYVANAVEESRRIAAFHSQHRSLQAAPKSATPLLLTTRQIIQPPAATFDEICDSVASLAQNLSYDAGRGLGLPPADYVLYFANELNRDGAIAPSQFIAELSDFDIKPIFDRNGHRISATLTPLSWDMKMVECGSVTPLANATSLCIVREFLAEMEQIFITPQLQRDARYRAIHSGYSFHHSRWRHEADSNPSVRMNPS